MKKTNKLASAKRIPEMSWDEIFVLPAENVHNTKILEFRKKEWAKRKK